MAATDTVVPSDRPLSPDEAAPAAIRTGARDVRRATIMREINAALDRGQRSLCVSYMLGYLWTMHAREVHDVLDLFRAAGWSVALRVDRGGRTYAAFAAGAS